MRKPTKTRITPTKTRITPKMVAKWWKRGWELYLKDRQRLGFDDGSLNPTQQEMNRRCDI